MRLSKARCTRWRSETQAVASPCCSATFKLCSRSITKFWHTSKSELSWQAPAPLHQRFLKDLCQVDLLINLAMLTKNWKSSSWCSLTTSICQRKLSSKVVTMSVHHKSWSGFLSKLSTLWQSLATRCLKNLSAKHASGTIKDCLLLIVRFLFRESLSNLKKWWPRKSSLTTISHQWSSCCNSWFFLMIEKMLLRQWLSL